jgi:hypothetical protein
VETTVEGHTGTINTLEGEVSAHGARLTATETSIDDLEVEADQLAGRVNTAELAIDAHGVTLTAIEGDVSDLGTTVSQATVDIDAHGVRLTAAEQGIEDADGRVDQAFSEIQVEKDRITSTVATLNKDPDDDDQYSSIKQVAGEITSTVAKLELDSDDPEQYSSIKQTADSIRNVVVTLNSDPDAEGQYSVIEQLAGQITLAIGDVTRLEGIVETLDEGYNNAGIESMAGEQIMTMAGAPLKTVQVMGLNAVFAAISLTQNQIDQVVAASATHYSLITQNTQSITQRVRVGDIIASLTLNEAGARIQGRNIELDGEVNVTGNVRITDPNNLGYRFEVWDAADQLRMAMGNIRNLPGVPPGDQFGLWGQWGTHIRMLGVAAFWPLLSYSQRQFSLYPDPARLSEQIQPNATQFMFSDWLTLDLPQLPAGVARHFFITANNVLSGTSIGYDGHTAGRLIPEDFQFQLMYRTGPSASWQTLAPGVLRVTIPAGTTTAYECRIRMTANLRNIYSDWLRTLGTADYRYGFGTAQLACNYVLGNMSA